MSPRQLCLYGLAVFGALPVQTALGEDAVTEVLSPTTEVKSAGFGELGRAWSEFVESKGWSDGELNAGGVLYLPERQFVVASAKEYVQVARGQPGWIESRLVAFERAELEAKVKIARFLSESSQARRSLALLENASWSDGTVEEVEKLSETEKTLRRLGDKSIALTDAALDSLLHELDPDYDPSRYEEWPREEIETVLEETFNRRLGSLATRTIAGVVPVYSTESEDNGQYGVLVGVAWSPKLNRLAMSLFNRSESSPSVAPGRLLREYIPTNTNTLIGTLGTRVFVDENGDLSVLAFGQAQPRDTSSRREASALQLAKQVAGERARAQLVNFIREGVSFRSSEDSEELLREFSDYSVGAKNVREIRRAIRGREQRVSIRGLHVLGEWDAVHPVTGNKVAGAIIAWSPSSAALSREMGETMRDAERTTPKKAGQENASPEDATLESLDVDTSAY